MSTKSKNAKEVMDKISGPLKFGSLLHSLRICDEVSQAELARRVGVSRGLICDIEKGRRDATIEIVVKFAKALGYPAEGFVSVLLQEQIRRAKLNFKVTVSKAA